MNDKPTKLNWLQRIYYSFLARRMMKRFRRAFTGILNSPFGEAKRAIVKLRWHISNAPDADFTRLLLESLDMLEASVTIKEYVRSRDENVLQSFTPHTNE